MALRHQPRAVYPITHLLAPGHATCQATSSPILLPFVCLAGIQRYHRLHVLSRIGSCLAIPPSAYLISYHVTDTAIHTQRARVAQESRLAKSFQGGPKSHHPSGVDQQLTSREQIHGLRGANQKSDALIDQLVSHFSSTGIPPASRPESPGLTNGAKGNGRRLKSIDIQTTGRIKDVPRRPATATATARPAASRPQPSRPASRTVAPPETDAGPAANEMASAEWEERFRILEERQRRAQAESDEKLKNVEEKLAAVEAELAAVKAEMEDRLAGLQVN